MPGLAGGLCSVCGRSTSGPIPVSWSRHRGVGFVAGFLRWLQTAAVSPAAIDRQGTTASDRGKLAGGRWDTDERHAYVANVGDGCAYDVSITEGEQVVATAKTVPAYCADQLMSTSRPTCYLNFCIHEDVQHRTAVNASSTVLGAQPASTNRARRHVAVVVSWRGEDGEWSTQRVLAD